MSGRLDSFLAEVLEHVKDEHVLLEVVLQCLQVQEDLQPPPFVEYGPLLLHEPISYVHLVVSEQQQQLEKMASHSSASCAAACVEGFAQLAQLDAHDAALLQRVMQAECRP